MCASTWDASTFWLLWIMLLWTWVYKYLLRNRVLSSSVYIPKSGVTAASEEVFKKWGFDLYFLNHWWCWELPCAFSCLFYPVPNQLNESIIINNFSMQIWDSNPLQDSQDMKPLRWPFTAKLREATPVLYQNMELAKFPQITETHRSVGKEPEQRASASSIGSPRLLSFSCLFNSDGSRVEASTLQQKKEVCHQELTALSSFPSHLKTCQLNTVLR